MEVAHRRGFKGLLTLGVESLKIMALINGGAAVAILAYLGNIASRVLVQILLSVCFCRVNDFPEFRLQRPWPTFPEWWLLPEHRPDPLLYSPVILFDHVVQVFAGSHPYAAR